MNDSELENTLKAQGAKGILDAARNVTGKERVAMLRLAIRKIAYGSWPNEYLDEMIYLGDAAITEALAIGEKDEANIVCFNMSANLCDCWGDAFKRDLRHFEKGLAYADRALAFRKELGKPADKVAMAHWARGKHLLSLRRFKEAVEAFVENVNCLKQANSVNEPEALAAAQGFLALSRIAAGTESDISSYRGWLATLNKVSQEDPKKAEDVKLYVDQLEVTRRTLGM